ncbi:hypothetical protein N9O56_02455 [Rickettsiales bacterium]|nr:hypothetical protein [Rickettsiales bacterium]
MKTILKYILLTAIRDKLYLGILFLLAAAFGISSILGNTLATEKVATSIVYIAGSARIIFAVGMILFTCFYVRKSFDNKEVEFILSKAVSRNQLIISYLLGFSVVALFIFIPIGLTLFLINANPIGLAFWLMSVFFEIFILISVAVLSSLILKSAVTSILATLGFYILSRMMAFFVLTVDLPTKMIDFNNITASLDSLLKLISFIFPRLDLFAHSNMLIYGVNDYQFIIITCVQSLIYIPLLAFMSFSDFNKKQF